MFDPRKLNDAQKRYIMDHALEFWETIVCPPNDFVEDILSATCECCKARRKFVKDVVDLGSTA